MKKRMTVERLKIAACAGLMGMALCACGSSVSYTDGVYTGQSSVYTSEDGTDEGNGYGVVTITISEGKIADCSYITYEPDGTLKDESYGMGTDGTVANRDYYNKAQKAVAACAEYANMLVANGELDGIDAISGATKNYVQFQEAVIDALSKAQAQ